MKPFRILICILWLPQLTLAQKAGVVTDTIICKKAPDQSYAIYLPKSYSPSTPAGVILFFDPGAEGRFPVDLYKEIAEKHSLIFVGSNNSQNGPTNASLYAGNVMLEDVLSRFNINKEFIITSGFSGGARMSVEMADANRVITGVIGCGAAFNRSNAIAKERPIPFVEVIGQVEMNYQEALQTNEYLQSIHNPASLIFFYAYHEWPSVDAYEDAVDWHQLRTYNNPDLQRQVVARKLRMAQVKIDSGYLNEASHILKQMPGVKPIDSLFAIVQKDSRTRVQMKEAAKMDQVERKMQDQLLHTYNQHIAYAAPDTAYHPMYWKSYRRYCDKLLKGDRFKRLAGLRLIDFAWHRCSENYWIFTRAEQYRQAAMSAKIWTHIWPNHPRPTFLAARAFALQKRKPEMLDYLRQTLARGVKEKKRLMADPAFANYANDPDFKAVFE